MAKKLKNKGCHIITSNIEHHAVLHTCEYLARKEGFEITYVGVNPEGIVDPAEVEAAIRPDTILISIMHVNNEVGSVQTVKGSAPSPEPAVSSFTRTRFRRPEMFRST